MMNLPGLAEDDYFDTVCIKNNLKVAKKMKRLEYELFTAFAIFGITKRNYKSDSNEWNRSY